MNLAQYTAAGGDNFFIASVSEAVGVDPEQIEVYDKQPGSIIILFRVFTVSSSSQTSTDLLAALKSASENGGLTIFEGVETGSYSGAPTTNGCSIGQYYDESALECKACSDDCPNCLSATECNKKSNKLGAILGGVLGGLAFILLAVILIVKKDAIFGLGSAKSAKSAKYNLANSSPTSPTVQTQQV
jgi:hypothetical protein